MRVVLDTNILVRAHAKASGPAREVFQLLAGSPEHTLIISPFLASELERVLNYPRVRAVSRLSDEEVAEVLEALASDARTKIAHVRDGLRSILKLLSAAPGTVVVVDDYRLTPPASVKAARRSLEARPKSRVIAKQVSKRGTGKSAAAPKRGKRASA